MFLGRANIFKAASGPLDAEGLEGHGVLAKERSLSHCGNSAAEPGGIATRWLYKSDS
ncbi:hypothetical protein SAMN04487769_1948 [Burkholderia sp. b14]|nr:hypothetical protein SAMN04487769_1948 [Burkholderia sp. b14]